MNIIKDLKETEADIKLEGRLDTTSAPQLEKELRSLFQEAAELSLLTFDFGKLSYVSSAGLRMILTAQKEMKKRGKMIIKNVNEIIMDVFEMTGFADMLNIE